MFGPVEDEPDNKITCLEPGCGKRYKALAGHVFAHKMSLNEYRMRHTQDGTGEDVPVGWTVNQAPVSVNKSTQTASDIEQGSQQLTSSARANKNLTAREVEYFEQRYKTLFYQADEDPALESTVGNIVLNEIHIDRYNDKIGSITKNMHGMGFKPQDGQTLNALSKLSKDLQDTNLKLMQSLNITREQKQKSKRVIESTPSRLVSAFELFQKNSSAELIQRTNQEMDDAAGRMRRNLLQLKDLVPKDVIISEEVDTDAGDGDLGI